MSPNAQATHQWNSNSFTIFVQNWKQITQDTWTLQTIQGYKIPFCRRPRQWRMRVTKVNCNLDAHHMEMAIKALLTKGAVREVKPQDDQFTSTLFLVQKENGDYRPIFNLCALNRFLGRGSFKKEGLQVVKFLIQQGDFMMKLDLKDAYYALPIHPSYRKYLRFIYQYRTYAFQCLPPGLSSTQRAFKKTHVITPPTEQGAAENLCSSSRPTGKAGLSGEKGQVLSHSLPTSNLSRSCPSLHNNDPVPPSTKTYHQ